MTTKEDFWNVGEYQKFLSSVPKAGQILIELLQAQQGERILDIGCGDGLITERIQSKGCSVIGVDSSPAMIKASRARGIDARLMDVQYIPFENEFDAVFSHATLHWIKEPDRVIEG